MTKFLTITVTRRAAILLLAVTAASAGFAWSGKRGELSLQELSENSDEVVMGKVQGRKVSMDKGLIITEYTVEITENLRGRKNGLTPGNTVQVAVPGGELEKPPIGQFVPEQARMFTGEQVALFLKMNSAASVPAGRSVDISSKLVNTPRVVGMGQGKFTVLNVKGQQVVTRLAPGSADLVLNDEQSSSVVKSIEEGKIKTTAGRVAPLMRSESANRDALEQTSETLARLATEDRQATAKSLASQQKGGIIVQSLTEFKKDVLSLN